MNIFKKIRQRLCFHRYKQIVIYLNGNSYVIDNSFCTKCKHSLGIEIKVEKMFAPNVPYLQEWSDLK